MGLLTSWRSRRPRSAHASAGSSGTAAPKGADSAHLAHFVASRVGVEGYLEPPTNVTPTTLLLVATDGEWTRRRVPDARSAAAFARRTGIPLYDVNLTGYPPRVREWTARERAGGSLRGLDAPAQAPARSSASASIVRTPAPVPPRGV